MDQKEVEFTMLRPATDPLNSVKKWRAYRAACATFYEDAMIAATAKVHGLTVATRNEVDFQAQGFDVFNPLASVGSPRRATDFYQLACVTAIGCDVLKGRVAIRLVGLGDDNVTALVPLGIFLFCLDMAGMGCQRFKAIHVFPIAGGIATFSII